MPARQIADSDNLDAKREPEQGNRCYRCRDRTAKDDEENTGESRHGSGSTDNPPGIEAVQENSAKDLADDPRDAGDASDRRSRRSIDTSLREDWYEIYSHGHAAHGDHRGCRRD